jgi:anti-anti-sigma factor
MVKNNALGIERRYGCLWIILPDSIDMDNYVKIEDRIMECLAETPMNIVLDFSGTKSLFSSGIGLIVRLNKGVTDKGYTMSLVNVGEKIREGFENVGLDTVFTIFRSEEAFVNSRNRP